MKRWLAFLLLAASTTLHGHELLEARVHVDALGDAPIRIEYDVALSDLELGIGLDRDGDGRLLVAEFDAAEPALIAAWRDAVTLAVDGQPCVLRAEPLRLRDYASTRHASLTLTSDCAAPTESIELRSDFLFDANPQHRALVFYTDAHGSLLQVATSAERTARFDPADRSGGFANYFAEGIHHILIGYDHLAFLCCLLIAVVAPKRAPARQNALLAAAWVASAFTLAHSLTLSLAAFGVVRPASQPVEIAIAASVVFAALNNLYPLTRVSPTVLAFAFGLLHGFGFAGALGELGLPRGGELLALLGFNLGVEAGQLLVVAVALPVFAAIARRPLAGPRFVALASIGIAAVGGYWLVQRIVG